MSEYAFTKVCLKPTYISPQELEISAGNGNWWTNWKRCTFSFYPHPVFITCSLEICPSKTVMYHDLLFLIRDQSLALHCESSWESSYDFICRTGLFLLTGYASRWHEVTYAHAQCLSIWEIMGCVAVKSASSAGLWHLFYNQVSPQNLSRIGSTHILCFNSIKGCGIRVLNWDLKGAKLWKFKLRQTDFSCITSRIRVERRWEQSTELKL